MRLTEKDRGVEIRDKDINLVEDLLIKFGYLPNSEQNVEVYNLNEILQELGSWGIKWKW